MRLKHIGFSLFIMRGCFRLLRFEWGEWEVVFQAGLLAVVAALCTAVAAWVCQRVFRQPEHSQHGERSHQLDGLRGLLACAVVTHHFFYNFSWREGGQWGANSVFITNLGAISVSLFFLMSGYLHFLKIMRSPEMDWNAFYWGRIKRIYPLYLAVFVAVVGVTLWFKPLNAGNLSDFLRFSAEWLLFQNTAFSGFQSHLVIAGVQWTLVYEWAVYAILPLLHMIYHRKISFQAAAWVAVGLAFWIIVYHSDFKYYWLFILALPAIVLAKPAAAVLAKQGWWLHLIMLAFTVYLFVFTKAYSWEQRLLLAVWFVFLAQGYSFANVLNHRGLVKLGDLSYAIYLLHGLVLFMWFGVWKMFAFKQGNFFGYLAHLPLIFAFAITLAWLGNRFIELPCAKSRKKKAA